MKAVRRMNKNNIDSVLMFKALADETRRQIVEMLAGGELYACRIQENFCITQPTLSYHMKILTDSGLVNGKREGAWIRYSLNRKGFESLCSAMKEICENIGNKLDK